MSAEMQEPMPQPLDNETLELWRTELTAVYRAQGSTWLAEEDNELRLIATVDLARAERDKLRAALQEISETRWGAAHQMILIALRALGDD